MKRYVIGLAALMLCTTAPAGAQGGIPVYDNTSYLKLIEQVKTAASQLNKLQETYNQAVKAYDAANGITNVNDIGSILNSPQSRNWIPSEAKDIQKLMSGANDQLGSLGSAATNIRNGRRVDIPALSANATEGEKASRTALEERGNAYATDAAIAEAAYGATGTRTQGLEQLRKSLDTATTQKQVQDIQARIAVEQAHINNDLMQFQAVQARRTAENEMRGQQMIEQQAAARAAYAKSRGQ
jgi:type IV secretion system protein VirB5